MEILTASELNQDQGSDPKKENHGHDMGQPAPIPEKEVLASPQVVEQPFQRGTANPGAQREVLPGY